MNALGTLRPAGLPEPSRNLWPRGGAARLPSKTALAIRGCRGIIDSMDAKRVIDEALSLPVDIRAALAGELLASLDHAELEPDREAAWSTEIRDRIDAYERGEVTAVPVDQALAQIRASELPRRTRPS